MIAHLGIRRVADFDPVYVAFGVARREITVQNVGAVRTARNFGPDPAPVRCPARATLAVRAYRGRRSPVHSHMRAAAYADGSGMASSPVHPSGQSMHEGSSAPGRHHQLD